MSREFGDNNYHNYGFFHDKIRQALDTLKDESRVTHHQQLIPVLEELYEIAYAISSVEACDSGAYRSINEMIHRLPKMRQEISKIEEVLDVYRQVAEDAVRRKSEELNSKETI